TINYAKAMVAKFKKIGGIYCVEQHLLKKNFFNLIINATSSGIYDEVPKIPCELVSPDIYFYDLYYQSCLTPFLKWCKYNGGIYLSDGLGMLVSQAAHSFFLWHSKFPNVERVIQILKNLSK
ncbi:shikimate dehydrogenase, partial [Buchnera aphidicola (Hormaphis cornu)]